MEFEWDETKAAANLTKHGVTFEEAKAVFHDPLYVDFYDPDHSYDEHRYIIIGQSQQGHLLLVSYTERGDIIRLIGARKATPAERKSYEEGEPHVEDELRLEYDLKELRVRKLGPGRNSFGEVVRLEPDVAEVFRDAQAVNDALRSLIEIAKRSTSLTTRHESG